MKRGTPDHPKMLALQEALKVPKPYAVGILELLWHFTAKFAPNGEVGRWPDKALARAMGWQGSPEKLVRSLVQSGWLDPDSDARLVVHDWHDHMDQSTQRVLQRRAAKDTPEKLDISSQKLDVSSTPVPKPVPVPEPKPLEAPPIVPQGGPQKKKRAESEQPAYTLPAVLDTPEFSTLFADWMDYKTGRKEFYQPKGLPKTIKSLANRGLEEATAALELAMSANAQGPADREWLIRSGWKPTGGTVADDPEPGEDRYSSLFDQLAKARPDLLEAGRRNLVGVTEGDS